MIIAATYKDGKRATLHADQDHTTKKAIFYVTHSNKESYNILDFPTLEEAYANYKKLSDEIEK